MLKVIRHSGFEIPYTGEKSAIYKLSGSFRWSSSISYTHNDEKIVNLPDGDLIAKKLFEGHPIKTFYDFKYAGIWSTAEEEEAAKYDNPDTG